MLFSSAERLLEQTRFKSVIHVKGFYQPSHTYENLFVVAESSTKRKSFKTTHWPWLTRQQLNKSWLQSGEFNLYSLQRRCPLSHILSPVNFRSSENCWKIFLENVYPKMQNLGRNPPFWINLEAKLKVWACRILFLEICIYLSELSEICSVCQKIATSCSVYFQNPRCHW